MNLVVLGVGKVGETLIGNFTKENHDISVIDINPKTVENVVNKYDVKGLTGSGVSRQTLLDAGVDKADFFIACTSHDEVNVICCVLAKKLGAKHLIARVRDPEYYKEIQNAKEDFSIDMAFNPEYRTAKEISGILKFPSAEHIEIFARGKATMIELGISNANSAIGKSIMDIIKENDVNVIFAVVKRGKKVFIPRGDFIIEEGDSVSVLGKDTEITNFCKKLHIFKMPAKSVFIIGGGKIGFYLAQELLSAGIEVKLVDNDEERCLELSKLLPSATILSGDGSDRELLSEENLERASACVTLTGLDEENAIISLYAKQLKVNKVITKISRPSVLKIADSLGLDSVVSPCEVIANSVLRFVRARQVDYGEGVNGLYKYGDEVEVLEFTVGENFPVGVQLKDLKIKKDVLIGGLVRNGEYILPVGSTHIEAGDKAIVVVPARQITALAQILR